MGPSAVAKVSTCRFRKPLCAGGIVEIPLHADA